MKFVFKFTYILIRLCVSSFRDCEESKPVALNFWETIIINKNKKSTQRNSESCTRSDLIAIVIGEKNDLQY